MLIARGHDQVGVQSVGHGFDLLTGWSRFQENPGLEIPKPKL